MLVVLLGLVRITPSSFFNIFNSPGHNWVQWETVGAKRSQTSNSELLLSLAAVTDKQDEQEGQNE